MTFEKKTEPYNDRRYGKPWIAVVDFSNHPQGSFKFGDWVGRPGEEGLLVLECEPGDVVAYGQKDYRNYKKTESNYCIISSDFSLKYVSKLAAYEHFRKVHNA